MNPIKLNAKIDYDGHIDKECLDLCNAMNSLPSIVTVNSCCGHGKSPLRIFFSVRETCDGLFFLTRCADSRYWKYGNFWKIELSVGDVFDTGLMVDLPITYCLHSGEFVGQQAYDQAKSLVENMNYHLNHVNFMTGYNLDLKRFNTISEREEKIIDIFE